jgi:hypothetical protein
MALVDLGRANCPALFHTHHSKIKGPGSRRDGEKEFKNWLVRRVVLHAWSEVHLCMSDV